MTVRVFIDGHAGTIGLRIRELLAPRTDIQVLEIPEERRKDAEARRERLNTCDVAILCLPDEASQQAVALISNPAVRVIDGSTAFRVHPEWVYGLPELGAAQREAIRNALRVSNPGCWPTCVSLLSRPLVEAGLLAPEVPVLVHGISGYSGKGKVGYEQWESPPLRGLPYPAPYALEKPHKHIAEMMKYGLLRTEPQFVPSVGAFAQGMRVEIPLHASVLGSGVGAAELQQALAARYATSHFVKVLTSNTGDEFTYDPRRCNGTNRVELQVVPHASGHVLLVAILDNLGKGASGAAVQSLNIMLGLPEEFGLDVVAAK